MSKSLNLIEQLVYHKKEIDESYNHLQKLTSQMNRLISVKTLMNDSYKTLDKVANLKEEVQRETQKVERLKNEYEKHEGIIIKLLTGFEDKEFPVDLRIKTDQGKIEHEHYTVVLQSQRYQGQKRILEIRKF